MSRLTRINSNRELQVFKDVKFERSQVWTDILGKIPLQTREEGEEIEPESEIILQRLIELYPSILPWPELSESPEEGEIPLCVLCKRVNSAETDILLVEGTPTGGRFVIVETKLRKNYDISRKVLGQILEYAAWLCSHEKPEALEVLATSYWKKRGAGTEGNFKDEMKKTFGKDWREEIWHTAFKNLRRGNIRLIIVSDSLPDDLRHTVSFLPRNVLLSGVEIQPAGGSSKEEKLLMTGSKATEAVGTEALAAALEKYFLGTSLSFAQVRSLASGYITSEAIGGTRANAFVPHPPYEEYLRELGGKERMPGKALAMLYDEALATKGHIDQGRAYLTFRLWGLAGLNALDEEGQLKLYFWVNGPLGAGKKSEVRTIFLRHFPDRARIVHTEYKTGFYFQPITQSSTVDNVKLLIKRLSSLFEELHKMKKKN